MEWSDISCRKAEGVTGGIDSWYAHVLQLVGSHLLQPSLSPFVALNKIFVHRQVVVLVFISPLPSSDHRIGGDTRMPCVELSHLFGIE